ncbi:hypothetical protein ABPG75_013312 [Micractinium tetrahymenae]
MAAATALGCLEDGSPQHSAAIAAAGGLLALGRCLHAASEKLRSAAAEALLKLSRAGQREASALLLNATTANSAGLPEAAMSAGFVALPAAPPPDAARLPRVCAAEGCTNTRGLRRCGG